jgi:hypothetical protein
VPAHQLQIVRLPTVMVFGCEQLLAGVSSFGALRRHHQLSLMYSVLVEPQRQAQRCPVPTDDWSACLAGPRGARLRTGRPAIPSS